MLENAMLRGREWRRQCPADEDIADYHFARRSRYSFRALTAMDAELPTAMYAFGRASARANEYYRDARWVCNGHYYLRASGIG